MSRVCIIYINFVGLEYASDKRPEPEPSPPCATGDLSTLPVTLDQLVLLLKGIVLR